MYDLCTIGFMYDVRVTFVLLFLRTSFVHCTLVLSTSARAFFLAAPDGVDNQVDDPANDGDDQTLLVTRRSVSIGGQDRSQVLFLLFHVFH